MPRTQASKLVRSQLDAGDRVAARYVDLQIDWVEYRTRRPIAKFGGLWDRRAKDFTGDSPRARVIEVHAQQITAIERFDRWFEGHLRGTDRDERQHLRDAIAGERELELDERARDAIGLTELFLSGGRRSGKTFIMLGILASYAIAVPGSNVWCVVPSEQFHAEPKDELEKKLLPRHWYEYNGWPHFTFYLANGSRISILGGAYAGGLKKGKASLVGLNEAQQISAASYRNARGAVIDVGGVALCALNPPTAGDIGAWTADAIHEIDRGKRPGAEHIFVDPLDNPHIELASMLAMRSGMTDHDWETQIRGRILSHPDSVLYTWDPAANERRVPDFGKITSAFLTAHEGDRARWNTLIAVDVQAFPWIAAGVFEVYRDPRDPENMRAGLLWMRDEVAIAQGDEIDVCDELKRRGIDGSRSLVIMDASCRWQQARRDETKQRREYTGKGAMDMFRGAGFLHVVPPDRNMKGNPDVLERIRATNGTIKPMDGQRGLFIDPDRCPTAVESVRKWRAKHGKPSRHQRAAHFGDVVSYCVWRFFPRRGTADKLLESEAVPRDRPEGYEEFGADRAGGPLRGR